MTLNFSKYKINKFNSNTLNITCADCEGQLAQLPDGLYKIKVYVCEGEVFEVEKYYLRTVKAQIRLDKVLIGMEVGRCDTTHAKLKRLEELRLFLDAAHANVRWGNNNIAMQQYEAAVEMLDRIEDCEGANCK